jgi:hypothetical protein
MTIDFAINRVAEKNHSRIVKSGAGFRFMKLDYDGALHSGVETLPL